MRNLDCWVLLPCLRVLLANVSSSESGAAVGLTPIGSGWYLCWASFNAGSIFSKVKDNAGINSVNGSRWLVYGYGIVVGNTCPKPRSHTDQHWTALDGHRHH